MGRAKIWEKMTVKEFAEGLLESQTVLIPLGVTEQHGFHLALNTDSHSAWQISVRAAEETGCFVAPLMPYTFSGGELPGTINLDYHLVGLFIGDLLRAISANGLMNIIVVLGHGGTENDRATREGAELFLRQNPSYRDRNVAIFRFWQLSEICAAAVADGDFHAGYFETSMMLHWAPEDVRLDQVALDTPELVALMRADPDNYQAFEAHVDHPSVVKRVYQRPEIKVGVMGDPSKADVEMGEQIAANGVEHLVALIHALEGRSA
jgi:creatinine amidohydrolase